MSVGLLCECPEANHFARRGPACGMYAEDQVTGGPCASCKAGFHQPCDRKVTPDASVAGACPNCHFHVSLHDGFTIART